MTKTVHFNLQPKVNYIVHWNFAYRAARKGPWETYALDSYRFKSRIKTVENILKPILCKNHRDFIFKQRFE